MRQVIVCNLAADDIEHPVHQDDRGLVFAWLPGTVEFGHWHQAMLAKDVPVELVVAPPVWTVETSV